MASKIILKQSATAGKVPLPGDLDLGEMAINTTDGKLFTKKGDGSVSEFTPSGSGPVGRGVVPIIKPSLNELNSRYMSTFNAGGDCAIPVLLDTSASTNETLTYYNSTGTIVWSVKPSDFALSNTTNPFSAIAYDDVTQQIYMRFRSSSIIHKIDAAGVKTSINISVAISNYNEGSMWIDPVNGNIHHFTNAGYEIHSNTGALLDSKITADQNFDYLRYKTDLGVYVGFLKNLNEFTGLPIRLGKLTPDGKIKLVQVGSLLAMSAYPYFKPRGGSTIGQVEIMQWGQDLLFTNRERITYGTDARMVNKAEFDAGINQLATNLGLI